MLATEVRIHRTEKHYQEPSLVLVSLKQQYGQASNSSIATVQCMNVHFVTPLQRESFADYRFAEPGSQKCMKLYSVLTKYTRPSYGSRVSSWLVGMVFTANLASPFKPSGRVKGTFSCVKLRAMTA